MALYGLTVEERFRAYIEPEPNSGCWLWVGGITPGGYGKIIVQREPNQAHRFSYQMHVGPIPDGLVIDHLCRVRSCVNPRHLEAVSFRTNILRGVGLTAQQARQTACRRGHPFETIGSHRDRACRPCKALRQRRWEAKRLKTT